MNKLEKLDQLISEVLGGKKIDLVLAEDDEKGGIKGVKGEGKAGNLELQMGEILKILQVGSESAETIKSSQQAFQTLLSKINPPDYSSAESIVNFFRQFDLTADNIARERCTSIGSLMAKYSIAAGLVNIFTQFNGSAGGFVNENYFAQLLGGATVPATGGGGIEDIIVGDRIGISLKVKTSKQVHGSMTQLLETLGIPYYIQWTEGADDGEGRYIIPDVGEYKALRHTPFAIVTDSRGTPAPGKTAGFDAFVRSDESGIVKQLYYLFFEKGKDKNAGALTVHCALLDKQRIIEGAATVTGPGGIEYVDFSAVNNPIRGSITRLVDVGVDNPDLNYVSHRFETTFDVDSMNAILLQSGEEVLQNIRRLDQWYGALQEVIVGYVSSLSQDDFGQMMDKLKEGNAWQFQAFQNMECEKKD
mgnify:CR=1 FL=1